MSEKTELSAREVEEAVRAAYTRPDEATTLRESVEAKCALLSVPGQELIRRKRSRVKRLWRSLRARKMPARCLGADSLTER